MKQRIIAKQLNELSEKGKRKLYRTIAKDNEHGYLLSIGQMIEFLVNLPDFNLNYDGKWEVWNVHHTKVFKDHSYQTDELCDALWEAIKEVLND